MRPLTATLLGCLLSASLGTGCVSAPGTPSEDVLLPGPAADVSAAPVASESGVSVSPVRPLPTETCRGRTDCGPDEVCVATRPGISECLAVLEVGEEEPADGPEGQLAPPVGMLRGAARFERRGSNR